MTITTNRHLNSNPNSGIYSLVKLCGLGCIVFLILGDFDTNNIPSVFTSTHPNNGGGGNGGPTNKYKNIPSSGGNPYGPYAYEGTLPWSECLVRYPGLLENEVYVPLPDEIINDQLYVPRSNSEIPVYVIVYNNPTFVKHMVEQIDCYGSYAVLLDSGSTYSPLLTYMASLEKGPPSRSGEHHRVLHLETNAGPRGAFLPSVFTEMPPFAAITDADIYFNPHLPPNFLRTLANFTKIFRNKKVGFALSLENPEYFWPGIYGDGLTITGFESIWWKKHFLAPANTYTYNPSTRQQETLSIDLYEASIDTTFAVYDVQKVLPTCRANTCHFFEGIRVANQFKAQHVPWLMNFTAHWDRSETLAAYGPPAKGSTISYKLREYGWLPPEA